MKASVLNHISESLNQLQGHKRPHQQESLSTLTTSQTSIPPRPSLPPDGAHLQTTATASPTSSKMGIGSLYPGQGGTRTSSLVGSALAFRKPPHDSACILSPPSSQKSLPRCGSLTSLAHDHRQSISNLSTAFIYANRVAEAAANVATFGNGNGLPIGGIPARADTEQEVNDEIPQIVDAGPDSSPEEPSQDKAEVPEPEFKQDKVHVKSHERKHFADRSAAGEVHPAIIAKAFFCYPPKLRDPTDRMGDDDYDSDLEDVDDVSKRLIGSKGFDEETVEKFVNFHSADWRPFVGASTRERNRIFALKRAALPKFQLRQKYQMQANDLAMITQMEKKKGEDISDRLTEYQALVQEIATLNNEITSLHTEWKTSLLHAQNTIQDTLKWEFSHDMGLAELRAAKAAKELRKEDFAHLMELVGWGDITLEAVEKAPPGLVASESIEVPEWFNIMDRNRRVGVLSNTPRARYTALLNRISDLTGKMRTEAADKEANPSAKGGKLFSKQWHEPDDGWPYPSWRTHGGWWVCRTDEEATEAEKRCRQCRTQLKSKMNLKPAMSPKEEYEALMREIERAMKDGMEDDKKAVKGMQEAGHRKLRTHRKEVDFPWRGWGPL